MLAMWVGDLFDRVRCDLVELMRELPRWLNGILVDGLPGLRGRLLLSVDRLFVVHHLRRGHLPVFYGASLVFAVHERHPVGDRLKRMLSKLRHRQLRDGLLV